MARTGVATRGRVMEGEGRGGPSLKGVLGPNTNPKKGKIVLFASWHQYLPTSRPPARRRRSTAAGSAHARGESAVQPRRLLQPLISW